MRAGVLLLAAQFPGQSHGEVLDATVQAALAAERAGFDDVWFAEHHFMSYGICPSAVTLAGYVLGRTRRIAAGTAVSVLSTQHPVALAESMAATIERTGVRHLLCMVEGGGELARTLDNITRLGADVLPAVRSHASTLPPPAAEL